VLFIFQLRRRLFSPEKESFQFKSCVELKLCLLVIVTRNKELQKIGYLQAYIRLHYLLMEESEQEKDTSQRPIGSHPFQD
jgi:hypothetical protein